MRSTICSSCSSSIPQNIRCVFQLVGLPLWPDGVCSDLMEPGSSITPDTAGGFYRHARQTLAVVKRRHLDEERLFGDA